MSFDIFRHDFFFPVGLFIGNSVAGPPPLFLLQVGGAEMAPWVSRRVGGLTDMK